MVEAEELKRKYESMFVQPLDLPTVLCEMRSYVDVLFENPSVESGRDYSENPSLESGRRYSENPSVESGRRYSENSAAPLGLEADFMLDRLSKGVFWIKLCPLQRFARRVRYLLSRPVDDDGTIQLDGSHFCEGSF